MGRKSLGPQHVYRVICINGVVKDVVDEHRTVYRAPDGTDYVVSMGRKHRVLNEGRYIAEYAGRTSIGTARYRG